MLSSLHISAFRGMPDTRIDITPLTAVIGSNGSGKTHILEAIHTASGGNLHYFHAPRDDSYTIELTDMSDIGPKTYSMIRSLGKDEYRIQ
jgi:AAA15 family ATPase/GTPase